MTHEYDPRAGKALCGVSLWHIQTWGDTMTNRADEACCKSCQHERRRLDTANEIAAIEAARNAANIAVGAAEDVARFRAALTENAPRARIPFKRIARS
jgi:hypothetical protein